MSSFLDLCTGLAEKNFETGQVLLEAGTRTGLLYILIQGGVEIVKDDHVIGSINVPGSVFGAQGELQACPRRRPERSPGHRGRADRRRRAAGPGKHRSAGPARGRARAFSDPNHWRSQPLSFGHGADLTR